MIGRPYFPSAQQRKRELEFAETVALVNRFILSSSQFINQFATECEQKILHINRQLQRVEAQTALLEFKVRSVSHSGDGVDTADGESEASVVPQKRMRRGSASSPSTVLSVTASAPVLRITDVAPPPPERQAIATTNTRHHENVPPQQLAAGGAPSPAVPVLPPIYPSSGAEWPPPPPSVPLSGGTPMRFHPRLQGYFSLAALRVPPEIVKARMAADGINAAWLDTPDATAPANLSAAVC